MALKRSVVVLKTLPSFAHALLCPDQARFRSACMQELLAQVDRLHN